MRADIADTCISPSTAMHQEDILTAHKGHYKFSPHIGTGIDRYIHGVGNRADLVFEIQRNFLADGMEAKIRIDTEKITIQN